MGEKRFETIPLPEPLKRTRRGKEEGEVQAQPGEKVEASEKQKGAPTPGPIFQRDEVGATLVRHSYGGLAGLKSHGITSPDSSKNG